MSTFRICGACAAAVLLAGCVSVQQIPLTASSGTALKDREITLAVRDKPDFSAFRSSTMALGGGLLAGAITISEGNRIVAENQIEDPAVAISRALTANLEQIYHARATQRTVKLQDDDVAATARQNSGADLILDVRTINWMFAYFPTAWTRYRVMYSARLRLIDVKRSQVVAEGSCKHIPDETPDAPSFDELIADHAARLKRELGVATEQCLRALTSDTLAIANPVVLLATAAPPVATLAPAAAPQPAGALTAKTTSQANGLVKLGLATPLPEDVKVLTPSSDVPAALAAYSGIWTGGWGAGGGQRQHTLVVEQIDGRQAQLIYSLAAATGPRTLQPEARYLRVAGVFAEDGSLRTQLGSGAVVTYRLTPDGRSLTGEFVSSVQRFEGLLQRRD